MPNLLQYLPSGVFFGRIKINGKIVRKSLERSVFTTAKVRLGDFINAQHKRAVRQVADTLGEARACYYP